MVRAVKGIRARTAYIRRVGVGVVVLVVFALRCVALRCSFFFSLDFLKWIGFF